MGPSLPPAVLPCSTTEPARVRVGRFITDNSVDVRICADMGTDSQSVCRARISIPRTNTVARGAV